MRDFAPDVSRERRPSGRLSLALAIGSILLWFTVLSILNPAPIADEAGHHLHAVRQFYAGDWTWPERLPMLPTYHALAALACKVFGAKLLVLRGLSAVMAIGAIMLFHAAIRRRFTPLSGDTLLHFAWNPILFPFTVMVYTESASMLCLTAALCLHFGRRYRWSAVALLAACLIRQSNLVWVAMLAGWAVLPVGDTTRPGRQPRAAKSPLGTVRASVSRVWVHIILLAGGVAFYVLYGGPALQTVEANRPRFNVAQLYLFAIFIIMLWAPIWTMRLGTDVRNFGRWAGANPLGASVAVLLAVAAVAGLSLGFRNPHPWNQNEEYFRNFPLIAMTNSRAARVFVACVIVCVGPILLRFVLAQPDRHLFGLVGLFSLLFLLPHSLAEPRYYVIPVVFLNLLTRYSAIEARCLTLWYALISIAIAAAVAIQGHPGGGVW